MKRFVFLSIILLNSLLVFGQFRNLPDAVVVNSNPPVTRKMIDAYIRFTEWHFEISLTPEHRQKYENLLIQDLKNGFLVADAVTNFDSMEKVRTQGTWLQISEYHRGNVTQDESDRMIEGLRGDGKIYGDGLRSQTMREAEKGYASSKFLIGLLPEYEKALIDSGSRQTTLYRNYVDALYEFSAYKMELVTGKKVERNGENRRLIEERLINTWKDDKVDRTNLYFWILGIKDDWLVWRASDFNFYERMTPFQKKEQLLEWGEELLKISPQVKPFLLQRIEEYKAYVAKMPPAEVKKEVEMKQERDRVFNFAIQKLNLERRSSQESYKVMRESLLKAHVTNLNISENIGNTGYVWVLK